MCVHVLIQWTFPWELQIQLVLIQHVLIQWTFPWELQIQLKVILRWQRK